MKSKKRSARPLLIASVGLAALIMGAGCGGDGGTSVGTNVVGDMNVNHDSGVSIADGDSGIVVSADSGVSIADGGTH